MTIEKRDDKQNVMDIISEPLCGGAKFAGNTSLIKTAAAELYVFR